METNRIEIKDKRTLTRLLRNCYYVYAYIVMSKHDTGRFVKLQKTDLMNQLIDTDIDLKKFSYETTENVIYIDGYIN
jgi:hypothetical protein